MNFKKHKIFLLAAAVLILIGISVSAVAVSTNKKPDVSSGSFQSLIADRIEIIVENTDFVIKKSSDATEAVTLTMFISLKKTQPDFYGIINSLTFSGIAYDNIVFTALNKETEEKTPDALILGAEDGVSEAYKWKVDITFSVKGTGTYPSILKIDYTSGMNESSAQQKILEIPISISVQ